MKIRLVEAELFRADGRKYVTNFRNFANEPKTFKLRK